MLLLLQQNLGFAWGSVAQVTVPDVVGETQAAGTAEIEALGLTVSVVTAYSSTVPAGTIISQVPSGGTDVAPGSNVEITVSLGEAIAQKGAGRRRKRRYFVEIDGQEFDVDSVEEAQALLTQAKALAERVVTQERNSVIVKPGLKIPKIRTPNKELVPVVQAVRNEIRDLYAELKRDLELRYLLAKADEEEEEAIIRLLM